MKKWLIPLIGLTLVAAACTTEEGTPPTPVIDEDIRGVLTGRVTIGPLCPIGPCADDWLHLLDESTDSSTAGRSADRCPASARRHIPGHGPSWKLHGAPGKMRIFGLPGCVPCLRRDQGRGDLHPEHRHRHRNTVSSRYLRGVPIIRGPSSSGGRSWKSGVLSASPSSVCRASS